MLQMASVVSAGMPTSHGRKYLVISPEPIMSHGCTKLRQVRLKLKRREARFDIQELF